MIFYFLTGIFYHENWMTSDQKTKWLFIWFLIVGVDCDCDCNWKTLMTQWPILCSQDSFINQSKCQMTKKPNDQMTLYIFFDWWRLVPPYILSIWPKTEWPSDNNCLTNKTKNQVTQWPYTFPPRHVIWLFKQWPKTPNDLMTNLYQPSTTNLSDLRNQMTTETEWLCQRHPR